MKLIRTSALASLLLAATAFAATPNPTTQAPAASAPAPAPVVHAPCPAKAAATPAITVVIKPAPAPSVFVATPTPAPRMKTVLIVEVHPKSWFGHTQRVVMKFPNNDNPVVTAEVGTEHVFLHDTEKYVGDQVRTDFQSDPEFLGDRFTVRIINDQIVFDMHSRVLDGVDVDADGRGQTPIISDYNSSVTISQGTPTVIHNFGNYRKIVISVACIADPQSTADVSPRHECPLF